jgi:hypothetical protein
MRHNLRESPPTSRTKSRTNSEQMALFPQIARPSVRSPNSVTHLLQEYRKMRHNFRNYKEPMSFYPNNGPSTRSKDASQPPSVLPEMEFVSSISTRIPQPRRPASWYTAATPPANMTRPLASYRQSAMYLVVQCLGNCD